ncbi:MAG: DUF4388 domain-containing protein [Verrucomicrobiales bacterium]
MIKILLVDDESDVLDMLMLLLVEKTHHGDTFELAGVTNSQDVPIAVEEMQGVDLLITDIFLPEENGFAVRDRLRVLYPNLRTLFISGREPSDLSVENLGLDPLLPKPFSGDVFKMMIDHLVESIQANRLLTGAEKPRGRGAFVGLIDRLRTPDLLQFFAISHSTGRLMLAAGTSFGFIFFSHGRVTGAFSQDSAGEEALGPLLDLEHAQFHFCRDVEIPPANVKRSLDAILLQRAHDNDLLAEPVS